MVTVPPWLRLASLSSLITDVCVPLTNYTGRCYDHELTVERHLDFGRLENGLLTAGRTPARSERNFSETTPR